METTRLRTHLPALLLTALITICGLAGCGGGGSASSTGTSSDTIAAATDASLAPLGELIFNDRNLSEPRGTACVNCHRANLGFGSNNGSGTGTARGSLASSIGTRNAMSNAYVSLVPAFGWRIEEGQIEALGGMFWDGRVDTPEQQALGPFLNPLEMNNASAEAVVAKVAQAGYAAQFRAAFGADIFANPALAFQRVGEAIAAFERVNLQAFSSKYDAMLRGQATLSDAERRGMALFMDSSRANCAGCHLMNPASTDPRDSPFSEFTYYATGIPRNTAIPQNADAGFFDLGLCGPTRQGLTVPAGLLAQVTTTVTVSDFCGKFRMPSLRNVARRQAYTHNGFFRDLREVVRFYSTRDSNPTRWYGAAGVPNDLPSQYLGNIERAKAPFNRPASSGPLLTEAEIDDLVTFLGTLSDGFTTP